MSAEIINLRQVRKQRQRDSEAASADENRVRHGLTKAERTRQEEEASKRLRDIEGHRLEHPED
ncbi:DUF4169 family protein [Breoghania sp. L-A4]|uniref:DUF4169 family protein n=1 Tax=Breoghania sp. L-A4 TaxID=2304600 RepID=UPI000E35DDD2|nr:DUF4169 family protein [Breoghania sp. L-A4]AXS41308.1 DUF4169 family protein [Breoghania sp. L-A4]